MKITVPINAKLCFLHLKNEIIEILASMVHTSTVEKIKSLKTGLLGIVELVRCNALFTANKILEVLKDFELRYLLSQARDRPSAMSSKNGGVRIKMCEETDIPYVHC